MERGVGCGMVKGGGLGQVYGLAIKKSPFPVHALLLLTWLGRGTLYRGQYAYFLASRYHYEVQGIGID